MLSALPTQIAGAKFLASNARAFLADEPRCGKTGAAIIAADFIGATTILIITTASGRDVWARGVATWTKYPRRTQVLAKADDQVRPASTVAIVGWSGIAAPALRAALLSRSWDLVIGDESHSAINFDTARTQAFFGHMIGGELVTRSALAHVAPTVWLLSGTPIPDNPHNLYPTLRSLFPDRLAANPARGWPDVSSENAFQRRYCVTRPKKIGFRYIQVFIKGQNLDELKARLDGVLLLRTQEDVGIAPPIYGFFPIAVSDEVKAAVEGDVVAGALISAAEKGATRDLEMHLGPMRRITGEIKARALAPILGDMLRNGLDKVVLMAWHRDTMRILREELQPYGVVGIDGATPPAKRAEAEIRFRDDPATRVFVGQITAAGEAIDLSAAALLLFVETSFRPKDMFQAALRITNHQQERPAHVQVCVLSGSIDEALQAILLRKWSSIREVLH